MKENTALLGTEEVQKITLWKKLLAEFIGTGFLVLVVGLSAGQGQPLAPLAIGMILTVMIFCFGHVSGGHFNPAVTTAILVRGKATVLEALAYVVAQLAGGFAGAGISYGLMHDYEAYDYDAGCTTSSSTTHRCTSGFPSIGKSVLQSTAMGAELMFTFALATVVLNVATAKATANNSFYGLAIGMTVFAGAVSVGPISGGAFNPAVGTALPAIVGHETKYIWIYCVCASTPISMTHSTRSLMPESYRN